MEQKIKTGDKVVLKEGSPQMTISSDRIGDDHDDGMFYNGTYRCAWFYETNVNSEIFSQEVLTLAR